MMTKYWKRKFDRLLGLDFKDASFYSKFYSFFISLSIQYNTVLCTFSYYDMCLNSNQFKTLCQLYVYRFHLKKDSFKDF